MEDLFVGLVRVVEERLGRFGKPVTTALVAMGVVVFLTWASKFIYSNALEPVYRAAISGSLTEIAKVAMYFIAVLLGYALGWVMTDVIARRRRNQMKRLIDRLESLLEEHKDTSPPSTRSDD